MKSDYNIFIDGKMIGRDNTIERAIKKGRNKTESLMSCEYIEDISESIEQKDQIGILLAHYSLEGDNGQVKTFSIERNDEP